MKLHRILAILPMICAGCQTPPPQPASTTITLDVAIEQALASVRRAYAYEAVLPEAQKSSIGYYPCTLEADFTVGVAQKDTNGNSIGATVPLYVIPVTLGHTNSAEHDLTTGNTVKVTFKTVSCMEKQKVAPVDLNSLFKEYQNMQNKY